MRVLILHGWGGSDYPHWQAKLAAKLACNYKAVYFPLLKNPHYPSKKVWLKQLDEIIEWFKPTVVVCHSLANTLWFWYANEKEIKLDKLYLIAMPSLNTKEHTIGSFFPAPMPKSLGAKEIFLIASTNDKWCSIEEAKKVAIEYNAKYIELKNAGHINADSGYGDWDWIYEQFDLKSKELSCEEK